jgi:peptidoglycan endopeptidase LytE
MRVRSKDVIIGCFLFAVVLVLGTNIPYARADQTYLVKKGDTLCKISRKYRVSVKEIREANDLSSVSLRPGEKLHIPAKVLKRKSHGHGISKKDSGRSEHIAFPGIKSDKADALKYGILYHTVKKGETIESLSRKYGQSIGVIAELNGIKKSKRLKRGMRLIVKKERPKTYIVKKGDTIWNIAGRFDMTAEDLMEINDLDSEKVRPGQRLVMEVRDEDLDAPGSQVDSGSGSQGSSGADISTDIKALEVSTDLQELSTKERLILFAKKMLDIPYRFGGTTFMGIDCSGYVQKVFSLLGISLPRTAREQYHLGEPVSKQDLSMGDLVFFRTYASFPSHVGIYLGNDLFIHASSHNKRVSIDSLDTPYYLKRFIGAKRLIDDDLNEAVGRGESG